jgi:mannitol-1-phosphate 5-dehydrogenase
MEPPVIILGAGKTGRGFIARLIFLSLRPIVFIDSNPDLVRALNERGAYTIRFYGGQREPLRVSNFRALAAGQESAEEAIARSDVLVVSVGAVHFSEVAPLLARALRRREAEGTEIPLQILTAENAIDPARKLEELVASASNLKSEQRSKFSVSESAIFCTTTEDGADILNIKSEDLDLLPYDALQARSSLATLHGFQPETDFSRVLRRKIYTYNCASACISYLGALKGYSVYSEAACDVEILSYLTRLYSETTVAICRALGYSEEDQRFFAQKSLRKFQNPEIEDSIERNARDVVRKLRPEERIVGPAALMRECGFESKVLPIVYAAALAYPNKGEEELQNLLVQQGPEGVLESVSKLDPRSPFGVRTLEYYRSFKDSEGKDASCITTILQGGLDGLDRDIWSR